jgi:hypothetical protein
MVSYNVGRLFSEIERVVKSDVPVTEGLLRVIQFCETARPHPDWSALRSLDIGGDLQQLQGWLETVMRPMPPPALVTGLWFGLFNPGHRAFRHPCDGLADDAPGISSQPPNWAQRNAADKDGRLSCFMESPSPGMRAALSKAVQWLERRQLPYGEFPSYQFTTAMLDPPGKLDSSPFVTTFVLYALALIDEPAALPMLEKGIAFLISEQEPPGVWRYWTSRNSARIDPDIDDTCCVSFLLQRMVPSLAPDNRALLYRYRTDEGMYKTWLREPGARNDVDSVVNANVLLYLGETEETRQACETLCKHINEDAEAKTYWYYLDSLALYYAVSRAYYHGVKGLERCRQAVLRKTLARQQPDGSFGDELSSSLAICTLLNLGVQERQALTPGFRYLLGAQQEDGSWRRLAFYTGPEPPIPHRFWWGSEELTTALCLEALAKGLRAGLAAQ